MKLKKIIRLGLILNLVSLPISSFFSYPAIAKPCINCHKKSKANQSLDPYANKQEDSSYDPTTSLKGQTGSTTLRTGTENTLLRTGTENTLLQTGTENTLLQTGTENTLLQTGTENTLLQANIEKDVGPTNILFLIDSSQSMREEIKVGLQSGKEKKMEAAKRVLQEGIAKIPGDINIGLRAFGNGFRNDYSDCQQSTLLVPIARNNRRSIIEQTRALAPFGLTPLTYGLMQAEQDLRYCQGTKTIILISDGAETCGGDPCAYIDRLSRIGIKMKIDIVGLGLKNDKEAQAQLNCIAEKSGGKYYDANTSADLLNSITNSVKHALSGKVMTKMNTSAPIIDDTVPADLAPSTNTK